MSSRPESWLTLFQNYDIMATMEGNAMTEEEVRMLLRNRCKKAGSQRAYAKQIGVSESDISLILSGKRLTSKRLLEAFGLEKITTYRLKD